MGLSLYYTNFILGLLFWKTGFTFWILFYSNLNEGIIDLFESTGIQTTIITIHKSSNRTTTFRDPQSNLINELQHVQTVRQHELTCTYKQFKVPVFQNKNM